MTRTFRQAATEFRRAAGSVRFLVTVAVVVVLFEVAVRFWQSGEPSGIRRFAIEAIPALGPVLVAVVVFLARLPSARAALKAEIHAEQYWQSAAYASDYQLRQSIKSMLRSPRDAVVAAAVFGSVVREDPTRDVDVIVVLDDVSEKEVRGTVTRLKAYGSQFSEAHGHPVHYQFFLSSESGAIASFLAKTEKYETLFGELPNGDRTSP